MGPSQISQITPEETVSPTGCYRLLIKTVHHHSQIFIEEMCGLGVGSEQWSRQDTATMEVQIWSKQSEDGEFL